MKKFFAIILRRNKTLLSKESQPALTLEEHWRNALIGGRRSLLPIPDGVVFGTTIEQIKGLPKVLSGIDQRLSTLEEKTLCKSYPLKN